MPPKDPVTAEEKLARQRERYWQQKEEAARLRQTARETAVVDLTSGREATCEHCRYFAWCTANVWTGELLPCQPQDQEPIYTAREHADFVQAHQGPANYHLPRRTTGKGIERPEHRE